MAILFREGLPAGSEVHTELKSNLEGRSTDQDVVPFIYNLNGEDRYCVANGFIADDEQEEVIACYSIGNIEDVLGAFEEGWTLDEIIEKSEQMGELSPFGIDTNGQLVETEFDNGLSEIPIEQELFDLFAESLNGTPEGASPIHEFPLIEGSDQQIVRVDSLMLTDFEEDDTFGQHINGIIIPVSPEDFIAMDNDERQPFIEAGIIVVITPEKIILFDMPEDIE